MSLVKYIFKQILRLESRFHFQICQKREFQKAEKIFWNAERVFDRSYIKRELMVLVWMMGAAVVPTQVCNSLLTQQGLFTYSSFAKEVNAEYHRF